MGYVPAVYGYPEIRTDGGNDSVQFEGDFYTEYRFLVSLRGR